MVVAAAGGVRPMALSILIILVAVAGSALVSASEAALISVNQLRMRYRAEQGDRRAAAVLGISEERDRFFGAILLTGNILNILIAAVVTSIAIKLGGNTGGVVAAATIGSTALIVVVGELTPKSLATAASERWSLLSARPVRGLMVVAGPFVWVFTLVPRLLLRLLGGRDALTTPTVTEGELRLLIDMGEEEGTVEEAQGEMLENVFRFGEVEVRDVMTPRNDIEWVEAGTSLAGFMKTYDRKPHTRFPVFDDDLDDVIGVLSVKDVLGSLARSRFDLQAPVTGLMRSALFVPETNKLDELFRTMQQSGHKIALIVDEFGGIAGLVTLTRIVEQAVGRTGEEGLQPEESFVTLDEDTYELEGGMAIEEANSRLDLGIPDGDYSTIAGFVLERLQHMPRVGDRVRSGDVRLQVTEMSGNKIVRVRARRRVPTADAAAAP